MTDCLIKSLALQAVFATELFNNYQEEFLSLFKSGENMDPVSAVNYLQKITNDYCGISAGRRTVAYDLAFTLFEKSPVLRELAGVGEDDELAAISDYWQILYPADTGEFLSVYDVECLRLVDYLEILMAMLLDKGHSEAERQALAYAGNLFLLDFEEMVSSREIQSAVECLAANWEENCDDEKEEE